MAKVNDIVRFLNAVGGGKVTKIKNNIAYVEDADGFEQPVLINELVVVEEHKAKPTAYERPVVQAPSKEDKSAAVAEEPALPIEETEGGDVLNVVLAYEPKNLKQLNDTTFFAYLVNDSNYFLDFTYMSKKDNNGLWQVRFHGTVEPNIQILLDEFTHEDLTEMSKVAIQYVAYKKDKPFKSKNPALVEHRLDTTKFYKLHCFHDCEYFDSPVIAIDVVKNDLPAKVFTIDSHDLERAMTQKVDEYNRHSKFKPVQKNNKKGDVIIQDLHIAELLDNTRGLSNADMLKYQIDKFCEVMNANIKKQGQKIIFIHGKGEGVLRKAILDELKRHYPHCTSQDASFREYGFGATQITIRG